MVTVTVEATWRMSRVEFSAPNSPTGLVLGYGEYLLQEPEGGSPEGAFLRRRSPVSKEETVKTYGAMPADPISRVISDVLAETVDIDGKPVTFEVLLQAFGMFLERWRVEDAAKPPPSVPPPPTSPE